MKQFILKHKKAVAGIGAAILIGGITMSFQNSPFIQDRLGVQMVYLDTTRPKCSNSMTMKEFDNLLQQLDGSMVQVNGALQKIDVDNIRQQVEASLKKVDMEKIMKDVELSLKQIDLDKIMNDVKVSLNDADWKQNEAEVKHALQDAEKELKKAKLDMKETDMKEIHQELEKAKVEIKKLDLNKIMAEARSGIDNAKEEIKLTKAMFTEMENNGLISSKDGFSIKYKNNQLFINGKEQDKKTTDQYRHYFKDDHFEITISKEKEN